MSCSGVNIIAEGATACVGMCRYHNLEDVVRRKNCNYGNVIGPVKAEISTMYQAAIPYQDFLQREKHGNNSDEIGYFYSGAHSTYYQSVANIVNGPLYI